MFRVCLWPFLHLLTCASFFTAPNTGIVIKHQKKRVVDELSYLQCCSVLCQPAVVFSRKSHKKRSREACITLSSILHISNLSFCCLLMVKANSPFLLLTFKVEKNDGYSWPLPLHNKLSFFLGSLDSSYLWFYFTFSSTTFLNFSPQPCPRDTEVLSSAFNTGFVSELSDKNVF